MVEVKDIHTAINAVMAEVGYVQKERKQGLNYSFASEKALIEALRPTMVANGIYMYVHSLDKPETHSYETKGGSLMNHTLLSGSVAFVHAPTSTFILSAAIGEGADTGDKSANKAMTALYKYALRQTFCIETGDDPDNSPSSEQERKPRVKEDPKGSPATAKPESTPKIENKQWMKDFNVAAKEAGSSIREAMKLGEQANLLVEMDKWQTGKGYTDAEALKEAKKLIPVKAEA